MEKIRVGVIGCSGMAQVHMRGVLACDYAALCAICDTDRALAEKTSRDFPDAQVYFDAEEMLASAALDAVIIVTPDRTHRALCEAALAHGLHVLCEKPLALTNEDCRAIVAAAEKSDRKFMVGQICRYTPGFVKAKELIDEGRIGRLTFVESEYAHDYKKILNPGTWRYDPLRNGVVGGGCHAIDLLRWVAGDAREVTAYSTQSRTDLPYDDTTVAILRFADGVIGKVFVSISCKRDYTMRSVFYGTKGTILTDNTSPSMTLFYEDDTQGGKLCREEIPIDIKNHNAQGEFAEFARIIRGDLPVSTSAIEGAKTVETAIAIVTSSERGGEKICL